MAEIHLVRSEESRVVKRGPSSWAGKDRKLCVQACYLWCFLGGALWWRAGSQPQPSEGALAAYI